MAKLGAHLEAYLQLRPQFLALRETSRFKVLPTEIVDEVSSAIDYLTCKCTKVLRNSAPAKVLSDSL